MNCRLNLAPRVQILYETYTYTALCMLTQLKVKNNVLTSAGKLHYIVSILVPHNNNKTLYSVLCSVQSAEQNLCNCMSLI